MARARNIKPGFFTNEQLAELPPLTRLMFAGLWTIADFKGCIEWRPKRVKIQVLPYDDFDLEAGADELERAGFLIRYKVDGQRYIKINNFVKHQNPHKQEREAGSNIPDFDPAVNDAKKGVEEHRNDFGSTSEVNVLIPDSLLLIPDSPIPNGDGSALLPDRVLTKNGSPPRSQTPVNQNAELMLEDWLDAVATEIGAKNRSTIADYRGWELACIKAISENRQLPDLIDVIHDEKERTRDCPEFFSPVGVLKKLQGKAAKAPVKKFFH